MKRRSSVGAVPTEPPHVGFGEHGELIRSAMPVRNGATNFVLAMRREIRHKFMSPADVAQILIEQPDYVRSAFPSAMPGTESRKAWGLWTRPWEWFAVAASNSAEQTIKSVVTELSRDENAYGYWCEAAEKFHGYECRFASMPSQIAFAGVSLAKPEALRLHCRLHGDA